MISGIGKEELLVIKTWGIRREDKNQWEKRVPLVPKDLLKLLRERPGAKLIVQPSPIRIFPGINFQAIGAIVDEDLTSCDLVMGVKEMPLSFYQAGKVYLFFSHTLKGQPHNMPMLKKIMELGCTLIDYERIVDAQGRRLVFFGRFAGLAGMIDTFWAYGQRMLKEGVETPFADVKMAHEYAGLEDARRKIAGIGQRILKEGLPAGLKPFVVGFTGYGNVSKGAQEIFDLFPHQDLTPEELIRGDFEKKLEGNKLGKVVFYEKHTVKPKTAGEAFDLKKYFQHPELFESTFRPYADHLNILVNCIYWGPKSPRILTNADAADIWGPEKSPRLKVVGDISCDIEGGIEFTMKETRPDDPVYVCDPVTKSITSGVEGPGPVVMAVDNLPCELPAESSEVFSNALIPFMPALLDLQLNVPFEESHLPETLKKATIVWCGELTPDYAYLKEHLKK